MADANALLMVVAKVVLWPKKDNKKFHYLVFAQSNF